MKAVTVYGHHKPGGLVHGCLDELSAGLERRGLVGKRVHLRDRSAASA